MSDQNEKNGYGKEFSDEGFWNKVKTVFKKAGIKVVYSALTLYYTYQKKDTPVWAKGVIIGALGYFISPIDAIPDITPAVGYADDIGVLLAAVATVGVYIDSEVKQYAKDKLHDWFGDFDEEELS
ncbi:YkvA family protein [Salinimicrobium sp. 3283s]|uniref:YkvA family protein n=1 Tax=Salinimicrobium sp. 3283s TaxID=3114359 RepID=UPI0031ED0B57